MTEQNNENIHNKLDQCLEALLFVASESVTINQLAAATGNTVNEVELALNTLAERYANKSGLALQWHNNRVQLTTAPQFASYIEKFLGLEETSHITRSALETLAIIAYQQPITRPQVDSIRGVNSDYVIKSLLSKGLIQEAGRSEGPGRPILYGTTPEFLQYFGLSSLKDLPPFEIAEQPATQNNQLLKD
jgi:segregation and condensation protein B